MTGLTWNNVSERYIEAGVDRGVFYTSDGKGIAWNGLTSVTESPSGGDPIPYYLDGIKYLIIAERKEFAGTIEAYTYPDEFAEYDGWIDVGNGILLDEQQRKMFGLSYRTRIGNDVEGLDYGYKIHVVYRALATPSESAYQSLGEELEPMTFSWSFTTLPGKVSGASNIMPMSHLVIDSTKTNPTQLQFIEEVLYGLATTDAILPDVEQMLVYFANPMTTLKIMASPSTGMAPLFESTTLIGDLKGRTNEGLYLRTSSSHLLEQTTPGLNILFNPSLYMMGA